MGLRFTTRAMDPIPLQEAIQRVRAPWSLFAGRDVILQEGCVARIEANGPDRCRQLRAQAAAHDAGDAVWLGGLAFDAEHDGRGAWHGFPAASFCLPKRQWRWRDGRVLETTCDAPELPPPAQPEAPPLSTSTPAQWRQDVAKACQAIRDGTIQKVVLARCEGARSTDARQDLLRLMEAEEGLAFAYDRGGAMFYGVSPERLVRLEGRDVTTHALAGSGAPGARAGRQLLSSQKDVLEHEYVAAYVRQRLEDAGVQDVQALPRRLRPLRHVQHLETPMAGKAAAESHVLDLVAALHPTPAVCGTPVATSLEIIRRLEAFPRGWYAGAVGWFDGRGQGEFAVALRCALQAAGSRYLFAGAGIVAGSQPESEWEETGTKLATLREAA